MLCLIWSLYKHQNVQETILILLILYILYRKCIRAISILILDLQIYYTMTFNSISSCRSQISAIELKVTH